MGADPLDICKAENEGTDSIRERRWIKDHNRFLNGRTRRGRLIAIESSDEEMGEERKGRAVMNKAKLEVL